jgi:DNA mismatch endonuclease (patch repair protein)
MALRRVLHGLGPRYRLDLNVVPRTRRTVDIVFGPSRVAVFVDGCFWHGCGAHRGQVPKANQQFWREKIRENVARDRDTDRRLTEAGWAVVRVWEHEDMDAAAHRIEALVRRG